MNYFQVPAISNSNLSTFSYDPSLYYKVHVTKEITDKKESSALTLGSLIHCLYLEPQEFASRYVVGLVPPPTGMMLEFVNALFQQENPELEPAIKDPVRVDAAYAKSGYKITKDKVLENFRKPEVQAYYDELYSSLGKTLISKNDYELAEKCVTLINNYPQWEQILGEDYEWKAYKELEIFWEEDGLQFKSKLDAMLVRRVGDSIFVKYFDLKTDSQRPVHKYMETFMYWKTYRQMAFYKKAIHKWVEQNIPDAETLNVSMYIIAVDVVRLKTLIYNIDKSFLVKGTEEIQKDIADLKWHLKEDLWEYPKSTYDVLRATGMPVLVDTEYYQNLGIMDLKLTV